jgi:ABC-type sugar transport system ATPase subunit
MSSIHLVQVTKEYERGGLLAGAPRARGLVGTQSDRAFADRVRGQMEAERASRTGTKGKVKALDQVTLDIPDGQTVAVVGPSGCGKSTLLRVIAGLIGDYTGHVYYDDQDMREVPSRDRYIGMVFQSYALYPHFPGRGNLSFFFRLHKVSDEETERRVRITSEIMGFGFDELLKRKPGTLSGGQQQRLAIGRAIVRNPRLFLFDEPLSNLDAKLRAQTRVEIKRLLHRFQITAIYVTHDQVEATTLGDQIAVMREGRIEQVGTFGELMDAPVNAFVAGFLGIPPMNLLTGGAVADGALVLDGVHVPLPAGLREQVAAGQELTLGVRAEALSPLLGESTERAGIRLSGQVESVEPDFSRRTQTLYVRVGSLLCAAQGPLEPVVNVGERLEVVLAPESLYFFDVQSGKRLA